MPRYFFHIRHGHTFTRDEEGQELAGAAEAHREAICTGREILGEKLLHGGELDCRVIEIADEAGQMIGSVNVNDVLYENGEFRTYTDDVTQSAPVNTPRE